MNILRTKQHVATEKWAVHHLFAMLRIGLGIALMAFVLASCSETEGDDGEFDDWQNRNETYFSKVYADAQQRISAGDTSWKILRKWSLPADNAGFQAKATDHIVVHVISAGTSTSGSPLYNDSVRVNYVGRLIPSKSYSSGFVFSRSYLGAYNAETAQPVTLGVNRVDDGRATALQQMRIGDRWEVYVPYALGYGTGTSGSVPAYSTLIFDMSLAGFYHPGAAVPTSKAGAKGKQAVGRWITK